MKMSKKDKLIEQLSNLDDSSVEKLLKLIEAVPDSDEPKKRKQNRGKNEKEVDKPAPVVKIEGQQARPQRTGARRQRKSSTDTSSVRRGQGRGSVASVPQPMFIGPRENKFLKMGMANRHKQDTKLQKLLSGDNEITERRDPLELASAFCTECEYVFEDVHPSLVANDENGAYFVCDDCQMSRAKRG